MSCRIRFHAFAVEISKPDTMLRFDFHEERLATPEELAATNMPIRPTTTSVTASSRTRAARGAAHAEIVLYPQKLKTLEMWQGDASVEVIPPRHWYENPTMFAILEKLAGLPNFGFRNASRRRMLSNLNVADSRVLEQS